MTVLNASRSRSSTAVVRSLAALPHRVVDPVGEERPVREVRERVVERLVPQLGFEAVALRDVLDRDEHGRRGRGTVSWCEFTSTSIGRPSFSWWRHTPDRCISEPLDLELGEQALGFVVRADVGDEPVEELFARVAVVMDRGLVHLEERERLARRRPTSAAGCRRTAGARSLRSRGARHRSRGARPRSVPARRSWCRAGAG